MEIWKDIPGYEGLYQVSNIGNIKSLDRLIKDGNHYRKIKGKNIKKVISVGGYYRVHLSKNGLTKLYRVNRLVAQAFIPNPNNYEYVLHKIAVSDGGTNEVSNLYWGTAKDNILDELRDRHHPWQKRGKYNKNSKKIIQFNLKNEYIKQWECICEINRQLKIPKNSIIKCCQGIYKKAGGYIWKYKEE